MSKQSTIIFNTLGPNGPALALHLLKQQGFVEVKSLRVLDTDALAHSIYQALNEQGVQLGNMSIEVIKEVIERCEKE